MNSDPKRDKTKEDICNYLKQGLLKKDASVMAGIDESTLYRWMNDDASFASRVEASVLEYKHSLIKYVNTSAVNDGRLALEVLRRRFPDEWSVPRIIQYDEKYEIRTMADEFRKRLVEKMIEKSLEEDTFFKTEEASQLQS
jgi:hypothetical protein